MAVELGTVRNYRWRKKGRRTGGKGVIGRRMVVGGDGTNVSPMNLPLRRLCTGGTGKAMARGD